MGFCFLFFSVGSVESLVLLEGEINLSPSLRSAGIYYSYVNPLVLIGLRFLSILRWK